MKVNFENDEPSITFGELGIYETFICPSLYPKDYVFIDIGNGYAVCLTNTEVDADFRCNTEVRRVRITDMTIKLI